MGGHDFDQRINAVQPKSNGILGTDNRDAAISNYLSSFYLANRKYNIAINSQEKNL